MIPLTRGAGVGAGGAGAYQRSRSRSRKSRSLPEDLELTRGAGVIFSYSDCAPVPKFLNPDTAPAPKSLQISENDPCSNSANHQWNRNATMMVICKDHADSWCRK